MLYNKILNKKGEETNEENRKDSKLVENKVEETKENKNK